MRIAIPYDNGSIFQHFGHSEMFKFYDVTDGKITATSILKTLGVGHGALAAFLAINDADAVICGGIGPGAQMALQQAGIRLYGGCSGSADEAACALIAGTLAYDPDAACHHHGHGDHACGEHSCGSSCH